MSLILFEAWNGRASIGMMVGMIAVDVLTVLAAASQTCVLRLVPTLLMILKRC